LIILAAVVVIKHIAVGILDRFSVSVLFVSQKDEKVKCVCHTRASLERMLRGWVVLSVNGAIAMETKGKPAIVENATEARQGRAGKPVLTVLGAALILALIAWAGAEWWGEATDPPAERTGAVGQPANSAPANSAPTSGTGNTAPTETTPHSQSGTGGPVPTTNSTGTTTEKP
jgi:hypothetical protein